MATKYLLVSDLCAIYAHIHPNMLVRLISHRKIRDFIYQLTLFRQSHYNILKAVSINEA